MLLKETSKVTTVTGEAKSNDFTYRVEYRASNNTLERLQCNVHQTVKVPTEVPGGGTQNMEQEVNLGYIILESGNKNIVLQEDADITAHLGVFDKIVAEVKESLVVKK